MTTGRGAGTRVGGMEVSTGRGNVTLKLWSRRPL